jgi:CMP-N-acetylneuraminate monooxygenase
MFVKKNKIFEKSQKEKIEIKISELKNKLNIFEDFFIFKEDKKIRIYDRVCDHAGGKLISKNNKIICPIHNWEFCIKKKKYTNGFNKKEIKFKNKDDSIEFFINKNIPQIKQYKTRSENNFKIKFINHACIKIEHEKFSFATDPWCYGPAFNNGWWLKKNSRKNWLDELNTCDFLYISHNHPDHLHKLSLEDVDKSKKIIIPKFNSDSTGLLLEDLGFRNIDRLDFNYQYKMKNTPLNLSILKSGDFREDSGLYFSIGKFTSLMDVDSNNINFSKLPNVTMYASSFSGGASGYPLMFDNFSEIDKKKIIIRNRNFILSKKKQNMSKIKPKYFFPYASYFSENLLRDSSVKEMNKKNSIDDYKSFCDSNNTKILNTENNNEFLFNGEKLEKVTNSSKDEVTDKKPIEYLKKFKLKYSNIDEKYIKKYFEESKFSEKLQLFINLTDDNFISYDKCYFIDFSSKKLSLKKLTMIKLEEKFLNKNTKKNKLYLKIRKESFLATIYEKDPWEDLLIGFSCKVLREPNIYNAKFWYHFTNNYISKNRVNAQLNCNSCDSINQEFDKSMSNVMVNNTQKI